MIEFHAWVNVRYSDYDSLDDEQLEFIKNLKEKIDSEFPELISRADLTIKFKNIDHIMRFGGAYNRRLDPFDPLELFKWLCDNGKGSYGLLYIHDNEDVNKQNKTEFKVWVLKRGELTLKDDPFLSPYFPECEKPFDPTDPPKD